ncbi:MAG: PAS domain S-box protein, partial [Deltaproteobacteria bacterium]|nr:PAS domain S-box protein [Deltaproteobacteria bacterium]
QYFRSLIENINDIIMVIEFNATIRYVSPSVQRILGDDQDELTQANVFDYVHPEDLGEVNKAFETARSGDQPIIQLECRVRNKRGEWRVFKVVAHVSRDQAEETIGIVTLTDITVYKDVQTALKAERDRAQQYLDIAGCMFVALDREGKVTLVNKAASRILGYDEKEILGKDWFETFLRPEDRKNVRAVFSEIIGGKIEPFQYQENPVLTKHGEERTIAWHNSLIRNNDGHIVGTLSSGFDMTERNRLEEQLRQSQKMEAVGLLAGGIAHDFNNLLTSIMGNAQLAMMEVDKDTPIYEELEEIQRGGKKAADLTRRLLAFSRKEITQPRGLDINKLVGDMEKMLRRLVGEDIELETILEPRLWSVYADPSQVEQVIMNLVVNSREAMPKGGKLTIQTANVEHRAKSSEERELEQGTGSFVMVAVRDTGKGMDKETQSRIFEPFFSTKGKETGTGLGLSTVFGIVKQNKGFIRVRSEPGKGTDMEVFFPKSEVDKEREAEGEENIIHPGPMGLETVLVVEDDDLMRNMTVKALRRYGFRALGAKDYQEAARVNESVKAIDILLTDVVMSGMNGKELAEKLKSIRPGLKILFMSGYPQDILSRYEISEGEVEFIKKPFSPHALARKIREVLDRK